MLPRPGKRRRADPPRAPPSASAADVEKSKLEDALQLAFALADEIGMASGRLRQIKESILPEAEQRSLLGMLFQQSQSASYAHGAHPGGLPPEELV